LKPEEQSKQIGFLVDFWRQQRGTHTHYAFKFFFCELLCMANVLLQVTRVNCLITIFRNFDKFPEKLRLS
jgi:hypothetical protein